MSVSGLITILFTDLVGSTQLLQRAGDEQAQRIFRAHHRLLSEAVRQHGGHEVKWLGDGLMVAFDSAREAVKCAIAMQQASRRPAAGERLEIRAGLNVGEALLDESDYFGTPVVVARRLCDAAEAGQIICSSLVAGLLAGRRAFQFRDRGLLDLKGLAEPVAACEALYQREEPSSSLAHTPFVGRLNETSRLHDRLAQAADGNGGLVMLVGEPGIGKTRTAEEFAEYARSEGACVLVGRCYEGEWAAPFGPFAEALAAHARSAEPEVLRADLGSGAPPIARLVPALHDLIADIEEPAPLAPDEERFRLLDAVAQFLIALSERTPVVLFLDDLHWADKDTIAMLRHVARFVRQHRILIVAAYRDVELDRQHPLSDALAQLRREAEYERLSLRGLDAGEVSELIRTVGEQEAPAALVEAIGRETDGNPFFVRETLLHLVDRGALYRKDGVWTSDATSIEELGIPEGVRQVIGRRLSRLSENANRLLAAASAFNGRFPFQTAAAVVSLDESNALDVIDEALDAQILLPAGQEYYDFTHALIRHTLYGELNPSRQVRLHRAIADAMSERVATHTADLQVSQAGELAYHYHRSAALPGAERGVAYALQAADQAQATAAWDEAAQFLRMALDLLPEHDDGRPRLLARYSVALAWTMAFEEAVAAAIEAASEIAAAEGEQVAAHFLADATTELSRSGSLKSAWRLAEVGLTYAKRRDATWSRFVFLDVQRREATNPNSAGSLMPLDVPEYQAYVDVIQKLPRKERLGFFNNSTREEALRMVESFQDDPPVAAFLLGWQAGEFRRARDLFKQEAPALEASGRVAQAVGTYAMLARCHNALGDLDAADKAYERSMALSAKLAGDPLLGAQSVPAQQLVASLDELRLARGTEADDSVALARGLLAQGQPEFQWARATIDAAAARLLAITGGENEALAVLEALCNRLDRIPVWDPNNQRALCDAAHALWALERTDHLDVIERNLREKVIAPDFRYPMFDGRLALARLCALSGRYDDADEWFQVARNVLAEQGARPLRAIVDYDQALMYVRRDAAGDAERAQRLLEAALSQFRQIGMPGWISRAEALQGRLQGR